MEITSEAPLQGQAGSLVTYREIPSAVSCTLKALPPDTYFPGLAKLPPRSNSRCILKYFPLLILHSEGDETLVLPEYTG